MVVLVDKVIYETFAKFFSLISLNLYKLKSLCKSWVKGQIFMLISCHVTKCKHLIG